MSLLETALAYRAAGLCVLPADLKAKYPTLKTWKPFQKCLPSEQQIRVWFADAEGLCVVCGAVSGNVGMIDFDSRAEKCLEWRALVDSEAPGLVNRLYLENTQHAGKHAMWRTHEPAGKCEKLAMRAVPVPDEKEMVIDGKKYRPIKRGDKYFAVVTLIETKCEGGLVVVAPSPGYEAEQGDLTNLPVLTAAERDILIAAARAVNEDIPVSAPEVKNAVEGPGDRPGDDFNRRGDVRALLQKHGWTLVKPGENEYWRRPGKTEMWSATLKAGVFYVFSSNAAPFEMDKGYGPFQVYALLEHGGDFSAAANALRAAGFGGDGGNTPGVNISALLPEPAEPSDPEPTEQFDPGPIPERLLRVPGFIDEVVAFTLQTAPYPEPVLAFCGALSLQALLAGRKVRDTNDNRTNLYVLGLANSGAGKDHPRKINQRVLLANGMAECVGDAFASGEGIEDRLADCPAVMFQTDEINSLMIAINKGHDVRYEGIMSVLLKMYSSANGIYPMRVKAGKDHGTVNQPHLCVFGTAIPQHYYEALSAKMLTNGFFARMLILEAGKRGMGQDAPYRELPPRIIQTARWWAEFQAGQGNLIRMNPAPRLVEQTPEAADVFRAMREDVDRKYTGAENCNDAVAMSIWARAYEKARRLALNYACSDNPAEPLISKTAVEWAWQLVDHQTRRMLFMASENAYESEFHGRCKKLVKFLRQRHQEHGDEWVPFWRINRRLPWNERDHEEIRVALLNQRCIAYQETRTGGTPQRQYRLIKPIAEPVAENEPVAGAMGSKSADSGLQ